MSWYAKNLAPVQRPVNRPATGCRSDDVSRKLTAMTTLMGAQTRVVASGDQVSAPVAHDVVILGMTDGVYYGLDAVGARVWSLVQEPRTLGEVAAAIEAEFDVTHDQALSDLLALANDLLARGLIEVVTAAPTA